MLELFQAARYPMSFLISLKLNLICASYMMKIGLLQKQRFHELLELKRIANVELTLERAPDMKAPMVLTPESQKLAKHAQNIANLLGFSIRHVLTGGASDASYATTHGIPRLDGLGPVGGRDHSLDEYLVLSSVAPPRSLTGRFDNSFR